MEVFVPQVIGMSSLTVAPENATAYARSRSQLFCDGADDQDEINEALEAAPTRLAAGTFNLAESVIVPNKGGLSGDRARSILKPIPTFAATAAKHATNMVGTNYLAALVTDPAGGTSDATIEDLVIDGNSANQTEQGHCMAGLLVLGSDFASIRNVTVHDVLRTGHDVDANTRQMCICLNQSEYVTLRDCNCLRAGYEALGIRDDSSHATVHGGLCVADDNCLHAAQCYGAAGHLPTHTKFLGTRFRRDNFATYAGGFIAHMASDTELIGCTFDGCTCAFNAAARGIVEACDFFGWPAGLILGTTNAVGATKILIHGNHFAESGECLKIGGAGHADIRFVHNQGASAAYLVNFVSGTADVVDHLVIEDNEIEAVSSVFRLIGTLTQPRIRRNFLRGTPTNAFNLSGTISGMIVEDNDLAAATNLSFNGIAFPSDTVARNNGTKFVTRNSGTATVPNGATVTQPISHGLYATPTAAQIKVTPTLLGNAKGFKVDTIGASTFLIHTDADPGVETATFDWDARCLGD